MIMDKTIHHHDSESILIQKIENQQAEIDELVDTLEEARARLVRYGKSTHEIDCVLAKHKGE